MKKERRKFRRVYVPYRSAILKANQDSTPVLSNIENISEGGIKLFLASPINEDSTLIVRFSLPDNENSIVDSSAKVVWKRIVEDSRRGEYFCGLKFEGMRTSDRKNLQRYLKAMAR